MAILWSSFYEQGMGCDALLTMIFDSDNNFIPSEQTYFNNYKFWYLKNDQYIIGASVYISLGRNHLV